MFSLATSQLHAAEGIIFYDGQCAVCRRLVSRWRPRLERRGLACQPLQGAGVAETLSLAEGELLSEMRLLTSSGRVLGGADALLYIGRSFWWSRWMVPIFALPGGRAVLRRWYRAVAARRRCDSADCALTVALLLLALVSEWAGIQTLWEVVS